MLLHAVAMTDWALSRDELLGCAHVEGGADAVKVVTATRSQNYPQVAHPGPAWVWLYGYTVDGGPHRDWGKGAADFRQFVRRTFPNARLVESWKAPASPDNR